MHCWWGSGGKCVLLCHDVYGPVRLYCDVCSHVQRSASSCYRTWKRNYCQSKVRRLLSHHSMSHFILFCRCDLHFASFVLQYVKAASETIYSLWLGIWRAGCRGYNWRLRPLESYRKGQVRYLFYSPSLCPYSLLVNVFFNFLPFPPFLWFAIKSLLFICQFWQGHACKGEAYKWVVRDENLKKGSDFAKEPGARICILWMMFIE